MPTVTESIIEGFAHCEDSLCPGNEQEVVQVRQRHEAFSYTEKGGDAPGIEHSQDYFYFADAADEACPHCGKPRAASGQERPVYPSMIQGPDGRGLDQKFLLKLLKDGKVTAPGEAGGDSAEVEALRRELAELRGLVNGRAEAAESKDAK